MTQSAKYIKMTTSNGLRKINAYHKSVVVPKPGVIGSMPCCHGDDEVEVYRELCQIVDEWLAIAYQEKVLKSFTKRSF